jgi:cytochrome c556
MVKRGLFRPLHRIFLTTITQQLTGYILKTLSIYHAIPMFLLAWLSACGISTEPSKTVDEKTAFQPSASIQEIMNSIIDPNADAVWNAVATVSTIEGTEERSPKNDEEWLKVRQHAITLLEASNLLIIEGRPVAAPGSSTSTVPAEHSADQIEADIQAHRAEFIKHAHELHNATKEIITAIDAKNTDEVVRIGGKIEQACESCHARFWYPGEKLPTYPN